MAKIELIETKDAERYVKSGDIILCGDDTKWLVMRLENSDFILYNLETYKYMMLDKGYIMYCLNGDRQVPKNQRVTELELSRATTVSLDLVIKKISSRCGVRSLESKVLRGEDLIINLEVPLI